MLRKVEEEEEKEVKVLTLRVFGPLDDLIAFEKIMRKIFPTWSSTRPILNQREPGYRLYANLEISEEVKKKWNIK